MFSKVLIANRGEIAVRIIRACKEMGISTVAVFSEADMDALHVSLADESYCIGPAAPKDSYLHMPSLLSAAILSGAQAIHPGYGFLSENQRFADLCEQSNLVFIGPSSKTIASMGDKDYARRTMRAAGLPVIPGSDFIDDKHQAKAMAGQIGYPLLIKARAGGGGRGIRLVCSPEEFIPAFEKASAEALITFGDGGCYLEKFLPDVKHIEVQLLCDNFGNVVCLGERECSLQRRNQKLVEESPSPAIDEDTRAAMMECARRAAKAVDYRGVGTLEFLYTGNEFYFMEMNTRLQVEHPVTEMVTGLDMVKWQIRVASGLELDFGQQDIKPQGYAIECRINAEDTMDGFRPNCGEITLLHVPGGPQVRFDTALYQGYSVPPYYDSMVGKLIVSAKSREEAIRKMQAALCELVIEGIEHTGEFHTQLLRKPEFIDGSYTTSLISEMGID